MAAASLSSFSANLQEYYLSGVNKQLNEEVYLLSVFDKPKVKWDGNEVKIHAWTGRNDGVGFTGGALPTAGSQKSVVLSVPHRNYYGVFQLDGEVIASAPKGGGHAFINWADFEMKGLVADIKNDLNRLTLFGGEIKGYFNEQKVGLTTVANAVAGGLLADSGGAQTWQYTGDHTPFASCAVGTESTWIRIQLIDCDTFEPFENWTNTTGTDPHLMVVGSDPVAQTLDVVYLTDNGAAGHEFDTRDIQDGYAAAVRIHPVRATDSAATAYGVDPTSGTSASNPANTSQEINGVFTNLSAQSLYGVARDDTSTTAAANGTEHLKCRVRTQATSGNHARTVPTTGRLQRMIDIIEVESGKSASVLLINPYLRATYSALSILTHNVNADSAGNLDMGFRKSGYSFAGISMRTSRHVPNGMVIFLNESSWKTLVKSEGKFADMDGSVFDRVSGSDAWQGYWRKYFNLVCIQPNSNMILTGLSLV